MKRKYNKKTNLLSFLHDMYLISAKGRIIKDSETKSIVNDEKDFDKNGHTDNLPETSEFI